MSVITVGMSPQIYNYVHSHTHEAWEIVLDLQGSGYTEIGEKRYPFSPGTIICQPPDIPHDKSSQEGFRDIFIQPSSFFLPGAADENGVIVLHDDTEKSFEALLFLAHRTYHKKENNYRYLVDSLFEAMNQLLISWHQRIPEEKDVERLKNRLIHSFTDPEFSVSALLTDGPYCNDHLRRRFKQATGFTPVEYLTSLRMNHAQKLMKENDMLHYAVSEIGVMCGYYDSHYFSRVFKKKTGSSPAEYLKQCSSRNSESPV